MNKFLIMGEIIQLPYEVMRLKLIKFELEHPFRVESNVWKAKSDKSYDYYITFIVKQGNKTYIMSEEGKPKGELVVLSRNQKGVTNKICQNRTYRQTHSIHKSRICNKY